MPDQPYNPCKDIREEDKDKKEYPYLTGGIQIAVDGTNAGTLGFIAETGPKHPWGAGRLVIVTNAHVLFPPGADSRLTPEKKTKTVPVPSRWFDSVGQPWGHGWCPSCDNAQTAAHVLEGLEGPYIDVGTAEVVENRLWRPAILDWRDPTQATFFRIEDVNRDFEVGTKVWKHGRTTGRTKGIISEVQVVPPVHASIATLPLGDDGPYIELRYITKWMAIERVFDPEDRREFGESKSFSCRGDSGAAVLDMDNRVVGLLFGGGEYTFRDGRVGRASLACWIQDIEGEDQGYLVVKTAKNTDEPDHVHKSPAPKPKPKLPAPPLPTQQSIAPPLDNDQIANASSRESPISLLIAVGGEALLPLWNAHKAEVLELFKSHRRVRAAWRYYGGAILVAHLTGAHPALPSRLRGRFLDVALERFCHSLERYASPPLSADIRQCLPAISARLIDYRNRPAGSPVAVGVPGIDPRA